MAQIDLTDDQITELASHLITLLQCRDEHLHILEERKQALLDDTALSSEDRTEMISNVVARTGEVSRHFKGIEIIVGTLDAGVPGLIDTLKEQASKKGADQTHALETAFTYQTTENVLTLVTAINNLSVQSKEKPRAIGSDLSQPPEKTHDATMAESLAYASGVIIALKPNIKELLTSSIRDAAAEKSPVEIDPKLPPRS